jgi:hypothetical protein
VQQPPEFDPGGEFGAHRGGKHRGDRDAGTRELVVQRFAESDDGVLAGAVGSQPRGGHLPEVRADVDDVSGPALEHAGQRQLRSDQDAFDVDVEDRIRDRVVLIGEPACRHDAGVVHQHC